jgi:hypothetical protein
MADVNRDSIPNVNRYITGEKNVVLVNVPSAVTVAIGDLIFLDNIDGLRNDGSSTANFYGYPIEYLRTSGASLELNKVALKDSLLGVALDDKYGISGSNDRTMSIATRGIFEFDLKPTGTVKLGNYFSATGTTTASDLINQMIRKTSNISKALGLFYEYKPYAKKAYIKINTIYGTMSI